jgi:predicted AAA+ superfamily ATPase
MAWTYFPRVVDDELRARLSSVGAVLVEGAKACGKTETARRQAASEVLLDIDAAAREAAELDARLILDGATPRLLDEWQLVPAIWNHVRRAVDARHAAGQFILTGSASPADEATRHTGAGRFGRVRLRPMTLFESGRSSGAISLRNLLAGEQPACPDPGLTLDDIVEEIVRGGWPGMRGLALSDAARSLRDYLEQIRRTDINTVDGVRRDPQRVAAVLASLARNVATEISLTALARDASGPDGVVSDDTAGTYLDALARLMVVEEQPAWRPHLRSSHQLRSTPTRHFVDPSLAVAALRGGRESLLRDVPYLGLLFESLVVRDLRVYAQPLGGEVYHYRDQTGLEVDAIVETPEAWGAFEVKLGAARIEEAAASLHKFAARVDTSRSNEPAVLGVIVGTGYGYVRADGVHVLPVGALAP